ncbi:hypothetical protein WR25_10700 [Diploscapter pachys]|uniref:Uncharacterized protein n=1 Tax=Diploscapter pachys TaxID=2018661 RepID=A0A2A2K5M4_9BILA|nr:hypothetical protein WR25_10700 [Diploscapter pachys]
MLSDGGIDPRWLHQRNRDRHVVRSQFDPQRLDIGFDRMFARRIGAHDRTGQVGCDRSDRDQGPAAVPQIGDRRLTAVHHAEVIRVEQRAMFVQRQSGQLAVDRTARRIDPGIDPTEPLLGMGCRGANRVGIGDVRGVTIGGAARRGDRPYDLAQRPVVARDQHHPRALFRRHPGGGEADPRACAGQDDYLVG